MNNNRTRTLKLTYLALILALLTVMALVPNFGMVAIPGFAQLNFLLVPVAAAAIYLGKYYGLAASAMLGILSFTLGWIRPGSVISLLMRWPHMSILPRIPVGLIIAFVYKVARRRFKRDTYAVMIAAVSGALANTALFTACMLLTLWAAPSLASSGEYAVTAYAAMALFPLNMAVEIAVLALVVPPIVGALKKANKSIR
jgi:uncharacterized membrane protein